MATRLRSGRGSRTVWSVPFRYSMALADRHRELPYMSCARTLVVGQSAINPGSVHCTCTYVHRMQVIIASGDWHAYVLLTALLLPKCWKVVGGTWARVLPF